jgi:hypothetical protein
MLNQRGRGLLLKMLIYYGAAMRRAKYIVIDMGTQTETERENEIRFVGKK